MIDDAQNLIFVGKYCDLKINKMISTTLSVMRIVYKFEIVEEIFPTVLDLM